MEQIRPNGQRARNAVMLIWMVMAWDVIALFSGYLQYDLLQSALNGGEISPVTATANDTREQVVGLIHTMVYLISVVTFILWFRRAYFNLHQKVNYLSQSEGWAAGSWFVPIICLYRPYQIMKELYQETKILLIRHGKGVNLSFNTSWLGWWWFLWIVNNFIGQFVFRYSLKAETIDEFTVATVASMIENTVGISLGLITVKVIKDYARVEPLLLEVEEEVEVAATSA